VTQISGLCFGDFDTGKISSFAEYAPGPIPETKKKGGGLVRVKTMTDR
jgi:hypothetical protein